MNVAALSAQSRSCAGHSMADRRYGAPCAGRWRYGPPPRSLTIGLEFLQRLLHLYGSDLESKGERKGITLNPTRIVENG